MSNTLHAEVIGTGPVWVILHGLFGDGSNGRHFATRLASRFQFVLPDLCNHGDSPRDAGATLKSMAADIRYLLQTLDLCACGMLGHSMGGKIAMQYAADYPSELERFIAVDIAPRYYQRDFGPLIRALRRLDLSATQSRTMLERNLARSVPSPAVCRFLLKSAVRTEAGEWRLKFGLDEIAATYEAIRAAPQMADACHVPSMFVYGEASDFIQAGDHALIQRLFPSSVLCGVAGAGHWVHSDAPEDFMRLTVPFMTGGRSDADPDDPST